MTDPASTDTDPRARVPAGRPIKLIVWDLDDTIWNGTLLEGGGASLASNGAAETIKRLDARGILHSISSRNDEAEAMRKLSNFGLSEYFLCPQIAWETKSESIKIIANKLGIGLDAILFVDDQEFERAEVESALPAVRTLDARFAQYLLHDPLLTPTVLTEEAQRRRLAYKEEEARADHEREFKGPSEQFLRDLDLQLTISRAKHEDLFRAEELVLRTNQLNSTGVTYSFNELDQLRESADHLLLLAALTDRFGDYGKIGLVLLRTRPSIWRLKLLLVSCRVISRGIGAVLLNYTMSRAARSDARFEADFRATGKNRMMQIAYRFANLREVRKEGDVTVYGHPLVDVPDTPDHFQLIEDPSWAPDQIRR